MLHVATCPIVFIRFYDRDGQGGALKVMINDHSFLVFLPIWSFSPSFWASKGVTYIRIAQNNKSVTFSCVSNFSFFLVF